MFQRNSELEQGPRWCLVVAPGSTTGRSPVRRASDRGDQAMPAPPVLDGSGGGARLCAWRTVPSPSALHPLLEAPEHPAALAVRLESDLPPARSSAGPPGAPLDPSLTQADRFLLVFRVCFCLAPFEIGYDVGGKAAASKPHAKSGEQQPLFSWKTWSPGRRMGRAWGRTIMLFSLTSFTALMIPYCGGKRELNAVLKTNRCNLSDVLGCSLLKCGNAVYSVNGCCRILFLLRVSSCILT